jgi:hypothetical protein
MTAGGATAQAAGPDLRKRLCQGVIRMFDIHQSIYDEGGEIDSRKVERYIDGMIREFAASPEAKLLLDAGDGLA